ncbi:lasso peptide biosynthesis B2 protein [Luteimonas sp. BDR2-5]|nr:lasso peptide biosynthesis B2 protein [Luteimonas sp. BDR2-5]
MSPEPVASPPHIRRPSRSALEVSLSTPPFRFLTITEVAAIVYSTARKLRRRSLKSVLDGVVTARRDQHLRAAHNGLSVDDDLISAASLFHRARAYVPVEPSCLLDSVSLARFLARRRLSASIVFGISAEPFSAHCWLQVADLALNETVSAANEHTPIRIV